MSNQYGGGYWPNTTIQWQQNSKPVVAPATAIEAYAEGLITKDEARSFLGLLPEKNPCKSCGA
jgi:hypothetical protein